MKAYIAVSFSDRKSLENEIATIQHILATFHIDNLVFVDQYQFSLNQEKEMMQTALKEIQTCDFLLAETTYKGIGIGIEAGYAKGINKPVVYLRKSQSPHSSTLSGLSNYQIIYESPEDLPQQLSRIILQLVS